MGIVTAMNHTLTSKVVKLKDIMKSLLKEVKKHVVGTVNLLSEDKFDK